MGVEWRVLKNESVPACGGRARPRQHRRLQPRRAHSRTPEARETTPSARLPPANEPLWLQWMDRVNWSRIHHSKNGRDYCTGDRHLSYPGNRATVDQHDANPCFPEEFTIGVLKVADITY